MPALSHYVQLLFLISTTVLATSSSSATSTSSSSKPSSHSSSTASSTKTSVTTTVSTPSTSGTPTSRRSSSSTSSRTVSATSSSATASSRTSTTSSTSASTTSSRGSSQSSTSSVKSSTTHSTINLDNLTSVETPGPFVIAIRPLTLNNNYTSPRRKGSPSLVQGNYSSSQTFLNCTVAIRNASLSTASWKANNMSAWLDAWTDDHSGEIKQNRFGFAGALGQWVSGDSNTSCTFIETNLTDCAFDLCGLKSYAGRYGQEKQGFFALKAVEKLSNTFMQLKSTFNPRNIQIAPGEKDFVSTFYQDIKGEDHSTIKGAIGSAATAYQLLVLALGFGPLNSAAGAGALVNFTTDGSQQLAQVYGAEFDTVYPSTSSVLAYISSKAIKYVQSFADANNALMEGSNFNNNGDIRSYLGNNSMLDVSATDAMNMSARVTTYLTAKAINAMWRGQKVFIMGGGKCGDNQGMGSGPQNRVVCRDGKAWYLYWWQEQKGWTWATGHKWGWTEDTPGAWALGQGPYAGISVEDVINSSLDSYIAAGYNYTNEAAVVKAGNSNLSTNQTLSKNPLIRGPSTEGVFTIPVCDIGKMASKSLYGKQFLLQPFGGDYRPMWCGPICDLDYKLTTSFIQAANMWKFRSPIYACEDEWGRCAAGLDGNGFPIRYQYCTAYYGA